jgi:predicted DNA-binding transcriptional regulator AlpA
MITTRLAGADTATQVGGAVTLADLAADPRHAAEVPVVALPALLAQCACVMAALGARLALGAQEGPPVGEAVPEAQDGWLTVEEDVLRPRGAGSPEPEAQDRWLTAKEAHDITGLGVRWLYHHADQIPGAKRFSRKRLRFREAAFRRWLRNGLASSPRRPLLCAREASQTP